MLRRLATSAGFALAFLSMVRVSSGEVSAVAENDEAVETTAAAGASGAVPKIDYSRREISFGDVFVRDREIEVLLFSKTETLLFRNEGGNLLEMALSLEGDSGFGLSREEVTLVPGDSEEVAITFAPSAVGDYAATLRVVSNDPENGEAAIPLTGSGIAEFSRPASIDPRRSDVWKWAGTVNLGPKAGNGTGGTSIAADELRNRILIGNFRKISSASLQLNVITGIMKPEVISGGFGEYTIAISESRDESYVIGSGEELEVWDLKTRVLKKKVGLGRSAGQNWWLRKRPMEVDEERNLLYVANTSSVTVVDLETSSVISQIDIDVINPPTIPHAQNIIEIALDRENQVLYAQNYPDQKIEIVTLDDFQIVDSIQFAQSNLWPLGNLIVDPKNPFLYAVAVKTINDEGKILGGGRPAHIMRIDVRDHTIEKEVVTPYSGDPRMALDINDNQLWVWLGTGGGRIYELVDLETFEASSTELSGLPQRVQRLLISPGSEELLILSQRDRLYRVDLNERLLKSIIDIGIVPVGLSLSEAHNQVYVARGERGGFFVLNAQGEIINSVQGEENNGILVDDLADRIYVPEVDQLVVYELSTLRRLHMVADVTISPFQYSMQADHQRKVLWVANGNTLYKLDLITGEKLAQFVDRSRGGGGTAFEIDPVLGKGYWSSVRFDGVDVFDLDQMEFIGTINAGVPGRVQPLAIDTQRKRLYIGNDSDEIVVDTNTDEIISTIDGLGGNILLDVKLGKPSGCIKTAENQPCSATLSLAVPLENGDLWC
jgi:DNA-binding beta-propeller fold protein YncE